MTSVAGEPPVKKNVTSARRASEAPLAVVVWMVAGVSSKPSVSASPAGRAARVFDLTTTPSVASLAAITWRNLSLARQRGGGREAGVRGDVPGRQGRTARASPDGPVGAVLCAREERRARVHERHVDAGQGCLDLACMQHRREEGGRRVSQEVVPRRASTPAAAHLPPQQPSGRRQQRRRR